MKKILIIVGMIVVLVIAVMAIFANPEAQRSFEKGRQEGQKQGQNP